MEENLSSSEHLVRDYLVKNDILLSNVMCSHGGRLWP